PRATVNRLPHELLLKMIGLTIRTTAFKECSFCDIRRFQKQHLINGEVSHCWRDVILHSLGLRTSNRIRVAPSWTKFFIKAHLDNFP
ncbi:hypothetical protein V8B97DRAFT_1867543, partial [Scleroderma yunnanense]